jgi:hypothetical protein
MARPTLDPGVYTNIFPVSIPLGPCTMFVGDRSRPEYQDLRPIRENIQRRGLSIFLYIPRGSAEVLVYGPDMADQPRQVVEEREVELAEFPELATRVILDGFIDLLRHENYDTRFGKGRATVFPSLAVATVARGEANVFRGFDIRTFFWRDRSRRRLVFGLVVDVVWSTRDQSGRRLQTQDLARLGVLRELAQIQGEVLPGGSRLNSEIARELLLEHILPFAAEHEQFELPSGGLARVSAEPVRVVVTPQ